jgi:hypothetical protein
LSWRIGSFGSSGRLTPASIRRLSSSRHPFSGVARWYAQRWKIEVFHEILKSGCRAEEARLRAAERLMRLIAVFCILRWRVFWMVIRRRAAPDAAAKLVLTDMEAVLLNRLVPDKKQSPSGAGTLSPCLTKVAQLGSCLARTRPAIWKYRHVAWPLKAHGHQSGFHARARFKRMWAIESISPRLQTAPAPYSTEVTLLRADRHVQRQGRYEELSRLHRSGLSAEAIAPALGISATAACRWLKAERPPAHGKPRQPYLVDGHVEFLERCRHEGCRDASRLWRELCTNPEFSDHDAPDCASLCSDPACAMER